MATAQVTVRGIEAKVFAKLKDRAKRNGRSFEAELRQVLSEAALSSSTSKSAKMLNDSRKIRALFAGKKFTETADLIREARNH